jgi:hypothetical protein
MRRAIACVAGLLALPVDDKPAPAPAPAPAPTRLEAFVIPSAKVKPADSDAPMAEGWPKGTEPGRIEVKEYPGYRSAVARGKGAGFGSDNVLFFPLFRHISNADIAMTTPVVSTYAPEVLKESKATGEVSMEFVYRSPTMGQTGQGLGSVKVEDHPAATYVCLGVQGGDDPERVRKGVEALRAWLKDHSGEWLEDGPPRRLGYHGPMTRRDERLWEVQLPIKAVPKHKP